MRLSRTSGDRTRYGDPGPVLGEGTAPKSEWAVGKGALFGCFVGMMLGPHVLPVYAQGLFVQPLGQEFGWTRLQISLGTTILIVVTALIAPLAGYFADRVNIRFLVAASAIGEAFAFAMMSRLTSGIGSLYLAMALMAILGGACSSLSFSRVIAAYFTRHRGTALGATMAGAGLSTIATPLLLAPYIASHGWRAGYLALAGTLVVGSILLGFFVRMPDKSESPESTRRAVAVQRGTTLGEAVRNSRFWLLAAIFGLIAVSIGGLMTQLVPMLVDSGLSPVAAARQASGIGVAILVARFGTGFLIDRFFAPRVAACLLGVASAGLVLIAVGGNRFGFIGALATGLAVGSEIDLIAYLVARYFGLRAYGRIYGVLYVFLMLGTASSPVIFSMIFQFLGSYQPALWAAAVGLAGAAILCLRLPAFPREEADVNEVGDSSIAGTRRA